MEERRSNWAVVEALADHREQRQLAENSLHNQHNIVSFLLEVCRCFQGGLLSGGLLFLHLFWINMFTLRSFSVQRLGTPSPASLRPTSPGTYHIVPSFTTSFKGK